MSQEETLKRRLDRERRSRKEAESLLEEKSRELYALNAELRRARDELEERVIERTRDLEESRRRAVASSHAKSEFLANMSHEIRTPMTAICGFSEILRDEISDPETLKSVEVIRRNGIHLLTIINDILDLARVESGKVSVHATEVNPLQLVQEIADLVEPQAEGKNLRFSTTFLGAMPDLVLTDPTRLRQILINLIGNAIKFTEVGEVKLVTRLIPKTGQDFQLEFIVIDTGIGIAEDRADRVFQQFEQADTSLTREFGGTGLGLTICRRFAELLGGTVELVESRVGLGSTFRASLAISVSEDANWIDNPQSYQPTSTTPTSTAAKQSLHGVRVLITEDSPINQRLFVHILAREGADVITRPNGRAGVDAVLTANERDEAFDVILMDMQMPVMDGYTATQTLRSQGVRTPIVALTAHAMTGDREKCLEAGCSDYVTKPIDRERLVQAVLDSVRETEVS